MTSLYDSKKHDGQTMIEADTGRRKKEQYIENLREGDVVNDFFAVKLKRAPRPYKRGTWFGPWGRWNHKKQRQRGRSPWGPGRGWPLRPPLCPCRPALR